jgi:type I restriction enzyme M protein
MANNSVTSDIVARLWNLCNILRDDGITYNEYVTELTYLIISEDVGRNGQGSTPAICVSLG